MADISREREQDEAREQGEPEIRGLPPEQEAFQQESDERLNAALAKLRELSEQLPEGQNFTPPESAHMLATMNAIVAVMLERGILSPLELELRGSRAFTEIVEGAVAQAEAMLEQRKNEPDLWTPNGRPPNRAERRHPPKRR